jgi:glycosyltransferase involved in cell wall biosynthesis
MRRPPLRRLLARTPPPPGRIFHHNLWHRGHTNRRYEELLPRLDRVDAYLLFLPERQPARGLGHRLLGRSPGPRRLVVAAGARRYRSMLATELAQIAWFPGPIVADVDDPSFAPRELELLARPNVVAVTVTAERAAERFRELGLDKPFHVVPQGVGRAASTPPRVRRDGELVVGYTAALLLLQGDRGGGNPLYNVGHLLELWEEIRSRAPRARLWLVGKPSRRLRARLAGRSDVELLGRVPPPSALAAMREFDVALYPRTVDQGVRAVKLAEYLGAGAPVVSYDYEVAADVREAGAGVLAATPRDFVEAVVRLLDDEPERRRLAEAAAVAGRLRDWDVLARDYNALLDRYLPPDTLPR